MPGMKMMKRASMMTNKKNLSIIPLPMSLDARTGTFVP
jgi:hypothetical protein